MKSLFPKISEETHQSKFSWSLGVEKKVDDSVRFCVLSDLGKRKSRN